MDIVSALDIFCVRNDCTLKESNFWKKSEGRLCLGIMCVDANSTLDKLYSYLAEVNLSLDLLGGIAAIQPFADGEILYFPKINRGIVALTLVRDYNALAEELDMYPRVFINFIKEDYVALYLSDKDKISTHSYNTKLFKGDSSIAYNIMKAMVEQLELQRGV